jgi:hypothetical protein
VKPKAITLDLARFASDTRWDEIPAAVLHHTKCSLINMLGVALHATQNPAIRILADLFEEEGGKPQASVLGLGLTTTLQNAAMANGFLAHLDDFDDTYLPTVFHPSAPTIPPALALAEYRQASGREFLTACALGLEVSCRVAQVIQAVQHGAVWHMTGIVGPFGAAAAAGRCSGSMLMRWPAHSGWRGRRRQGCAGRSVHDEAFHPRGPVARCAGPAGVYLHASDTEAAASSRHSRRESRSSHGIESLRAGGAAQ